MIAGGEVLVVKGALGTMGAGNTSVLMQLLVGMLDAALARSQDGVEADRRTAVALKVDEAPLVLNRGFAETMALKRSAGLETVACWQTDSQWVDRDLRAQLDALFAHRVYFATASVQDARSAASLMMAEFSDTVRPGIRNLSDLGRPDVRLHLPRHSAIASWVTPEGRQAPFVAHTLPLRVNAERLALHATRQAGRGGRYREDLSQPHWERDAESAHGRSTEARSKEQPDVEDLTHAHAPRSTDEGGGPAGGTPVRALGAAGTAPGEVPVSIPAESYRELVDLNAVHTVRWAKSKTSPLKIHPEPLDIEILALIASFRHLLSSQIHRRLNDGRAASTTQRRLKRLSDAGLVVRFQFHRRDGGGVPMCYSVTPEGLQLFREHGGSASDPVAGAEAQQSHPSAQPNPPRAAERLLRQARHDIRAAGWVLALERALGLGPLVLRGPEESVITPPSRLKSGEHQLIGPADLSLPGGRAPHDFLRTVNSGSRVEVQHFQTIRPDASLHMKDGRELLVELDDRLPAGEGARKIERYDHFLAGWCVRLNRYARPGAEAPLVVFVCRDRSRARECARHADGVLSACRAYAGEYPADWQYPGRDRVVFAAERDAHEGQLCAWGLPRLPPEVRVVVAEGDPRTRDILLERREIGPGQ